MLTAAELELLTAAVDGVLNSRQQRRLARLLESSAEARGVYARLERDAAAVRALSRRACPVDLSGSVLAAIGQLPRKTAPRRPITPAADPAPGGVPAWFALALAASVLFVIGTASFLYFDASQTGNGSASRVTADPNLAQNVPDPKKSPEREPAILPEPTPLPEQPAPPPETGPVIVQQPSGMNPDTEPLVSEPVGPIFTGPSGERIVMGTVEPTVPTLHKFHDLETTQFLADLGKTNAYRLELPCKDAGKAVERIQPVLKGQGMDLAVEAVARARLDKPQWKSSYLVVLEDITPEELATFLVKSAEADRKATPRKGMETAPSVFPSRFVLSQMNKLDLRDLTDHLGCELPVLPSHRTDGPLGVDPTRSLAEQTAEEIARKLSGGSNLRPALLLAYGMPRQVTPSADVRRYLDSRRPVRPGTLKVLLILRHVG